MAETSIPLNEPGSCDTTLKISTTNVLIWSKHRVYKNLLCVSSSVFLIFIGILGASNLQSTINSREGMGLATQAIGFAMFCVSSLLLPEITVRKFGCKLTLVLSTLGYFPFLAANFYPEWETLTPSIVVMGLFSALFWPACFKYLNNLTVLYKGQTDGENLASTTALFFGILDMFALFASTTGNLMSYLILEDSKSNSSNVTHTGCGIKFVDDDIFTGNNTNLAEINKNLRNILMGIYSCCSLLAVAPILLILYPLPKNYDELEKPLFNKLMATLQVMKQKRQLLLAPFALYHGMQAGFYVGDFTRVYVACTLGIYHVGLVAMCQSASAGLCSALFGRLRKYTGRIPLYAVAAMANIFVVFQLFLWTPGPEKSFIFFITSAIWGIFYGIYFTQTKAFYGDLFRGGEEESAFANFYVWSSIGYILSFSYSKYLFITTKLYLLILVFCLAQVGYVILEWDLHSCQRIKDEHKSKTHVNVLHSCAEDDKSIVV